MPGPGIKKLLGKINRRSLKNAVDASSTVDSSDQQDLMVNPFTHIDDISRQEAGDHGYDEFTPLNVEDIAESDPELLAADVKENRFKAFWSALPRPSLSQGYDLLAFQAGSFGLRGVLVSNTSHGAVIGYASESRNVDFTRAIAEVVEKLRESGKRIPKKAILITPSVISSIVSLPVSPLRPRSDEEMEELIRWELEGTLTQQNKHWLIGSMLVERGYLTPVQRDELVEELKLRQSQGGQSSLLRFGDLAVQLNYISQEQLEECFVLQGKLIAVDDDLAYGWRAEEPQIEQGLSDEVLLSREDDGDSAHKWLVSGISKSVRRRWVGAFNLNGIKLQALYPSIGSSFALLSQHTLDAEQAVLEVHQEQLAYIAGNSLAVQDIRVAERQQGAIRPADLQDLLGIQSVDLKKIYINAPEAELEELLFSLSTVASVELEALQQDRIPVGDGNSDGYQLLRVLGAADHYLKHVSAARLSCIAAKEKEASPFKKLLSPKVLLASAATLIVVLMIGFLGWMHWNMYRQTGRLEQLTTEFTQNSKLKTEFKRIVQEHGLLKASINQQTQEFESNQVLLNELVTKKAVEKELVRIILKSVATVIPDTVYITSLTYADNKTVIKAFSVSNTDGQYFVNALNKSLKPVGYEVVVSNIQKSETSTAAYVINLQLGLNKGNLGIEE